MIAPATSAPARQIRASFTPDTIRVYQAFNSAIADVAVRHQTFRAPFSLTRMTWVKPSFAWMMYRSGWATKPDQERVLGIDIQRSGFDSMLTESCPSSDPGIEPPGQWRARVASSSVPSQWDPERDLLMQELPWRSLQLGIRGEALHSYVHHWIVAIEDCTPLANAVRAAGVEGGLEAAQRVAPKEQVYPVPESTRHHLRMKDE